MLLCIVWECLIGLLPGKHNFQLHFFFRSFFPIIANCFAVLVVVVVTSIAFTSCILPSSLHVLTLLSHVPSRPYNHSLGATFMQLTTFHIEKYTNKLFRILKKINRSIQSTKARRNSDAIPPQIPVYLSTSIMD